MTKLFIIAILLSGMVSTSQGRLGIRVTNDGIVTHIYKTSHAYGLLYEHDKILKGSDDCIGPAKMLVHLKIKRLNEIKEYDIERIDKQECHD